MENKEIETIQEELKYKIITLDDEVEDSKIKKMIDDIVKEINQAFEKFKEWYEMNKDSEKAQEIKEKFVTGIDFLFYDKAIGGKTFKELSKALDISPEELFDRINYNFFNSIQEYKKQL